MGSLGLRGFGRGWFVPGLVVACGRVFCCDASLLVQIAGYGGGGYNDGQVGFYGLVLPVEYWAGA